jgi:hypothetical protein
MKESTTAQQILCSKQRNAAFQLTVHIACQVSMTAVGKQRVADSTARETTQLYSRHKLSQSIRWQKNRTAEFPG